jgi:ATP-dependent DNA helicase RecG
MASSSPDTTERSSLARPVETLPGIGRTRAAQLQSLGVRTLGDLLEYFPRRYQTEKAERPINQLTPGDIQYVRGEVIAVNYIPYSRKRFEATIQDPTGTLSLTWFNGAYLRDKIHPGQVLRVQGKVGLFRNQLHIVQPQWRIIEPDAPLVGADVRRAIYPASGQLSSLQIWKIIDKNLPMALDHVQECFSPELLAARRLLPRREAFGLIHRPAAEEDSRAARRRLVYDELMLMQLGLLVGKRLRQADMRAPAMRFDQVLDQRIRKRFPFELTEAQMHSIWEIVGDMRRDIPMDRLLQGDVGSGKTVVALYAMLVAIANKHQALLLAPTQILAEQHYLTIRQMLVGADVQIALLTHGPRRKAAAICGNGSPAARCILPLEPRRSCQGM